MAKTIVIVGTLNTKECEGHYLRDQIEKFGCKAILLDVGLKSYELLLGKPDISNEDVAKAADTSIKEVEALERMPASELMIKGATKIVKKLYNAKRLHGIIGYGGSVGTGICSSVERELPLGFPKVIVTTIPHLAGQYIGAKDIAVFPSITDMVGGSTVNRIEAVTLANAAAAISGMVEAKPVIQEKKPLILMSQYGNTTPHIMKAKEVLENKGYEVISFHGSGIGGQSLEELVKSGIVAGVLDITPSELSDHLLGGVCDAGSNRMEAASEIGIPQVILPGALDMVNFYKVPKKFKNRRFYFHTKEVILMRINEAESTVLGRVVAEKVNKAKGPTLVIIPLKGWSMYDCEGGVLTVDYHGQPTGEPWYDPKADKAFTDALDNFINKSKNNIGIVKANLYINDPRLAKITATILDDMVKGKWKKGTYSKKILHYLQ